jgi:hypothetical protein
MKIYTVTYANEDGDVSVALMTETVLMKRLNEHHWGNDVTFVTSAILEKESNPNCWSRTGASLLIMEGSLVVPKPVSVVTQYKLPR